MNSLNVGAIQAQPYYFTARPAAQKPAQIFETHQDKKAQATANALLTTGIAALAAAGIYLLTKGKGGKAAENAANSIKEMTVASFKNSGKFVKGKAVLANGEMYTGKLTHELKDGSKIVREFKDGALQSTSRVKDGETLAHTTYKYDKNGKINELTQHNLEVGTNGKYDKTTSYSHRTGEDGGRITRKTEAFTSNCKHEVVTKEGNQFVGKANQTTDIYYAPNSSQITRKDIVYQTNHPQGPLQLKEWVEYQNGKPYKDTYVLYTDAKRVPNVGVVRYDNEGNIIK